METHDSKTCDGLRIPLFLDRCEGGVIDPGPKERSNAPGLEPVMVSVPFPKGSLSDPRQVQLLDPDGNQVVVQAETLARWTGGSIKWLRLDFLARPTGRPWEIAVGSVVEGLPSPFAVRADSNTISVESHPSTFVFRKGSRHGLVDILFPGEPPGGGIDLWLREAQEDRENNLIIVERLLVEATGPVFTRVLIEGRFAGRSKCRFSVRQMIFANSGLLRVDLTLLNPCKAMHPGGLWDLGDSGSFFFREFGLRADLDEPYLELDWTDQATRPLRDAGLVEVEIYQESSGGEQWQCRTHVNRSSQVPLRFPGYRARTMGPEREIGGLRATPVVSAAGANWRLGAAVPGFWQEFPKSIHPQTDRIMIGLFPGEFPDLHELQGGERKTHTVWLQIVAADSETNLSWVYNPIVAHTSPEWYAGSGAIRDLSPASADPGNPLDALLAEAGGPEGLVARREIIDEYGWRNFGEVYADHEAAYYDGPPPCISHYNNQYDMIRGFALQFLRTGDPRWAELLGPLAKHVADIDIYHTQQDKAAYNGGMFWFTDHYKDAATCTHRTYSKANCKPGDTSYGGGPSAAHNFSAGLLLAYT